MEINYINNDMKFGIDYDYKLINKEFKKLNVPREVYNVLKLPLSDAAWFFLLSERSTGKTTNCLLYGMTMNKMYGTIIVYIRKHDSMITKKDLSTLFTTIIEYGYIEKLTDGKYNNVEYYAGKWRYIKVDENGITIERCPDFFMQCLAYNRHEEYKSSLSLPKGDFIIVDEVISDRYRLNEFVELCDTLMTVIRNRLSVRILCLSNTIDKHSEYFHELEIYEPVQLIEPGQHDIITSERGTKVYVELIKDAKDVAEKKRHNTFYFGFKNQRLNSITGDGWAVDNYPHIERGYTTLQHGIYIDYHGKFLELEVVEYDDKGVFIIVHRAGEPYDDSIIYSNQEPKDKRYRFHMGDGHKIDKFINYCIMNHRILFHDNACGTIFFNHVKAK